MEGEEKILMEGEEKILNQKCQKGEEDVKPNMHVFPFFIIFLFNFFSYFFSFSCAFVSIIHSGILSQTI
jgi:hypothetical protein